MHGINNLTIILGIKKRGGGGELHTEFWWDNVKEKDNCKT